MSHPRKRHAIELIIKKLAFNSVVAIQGARQTGKSFLARDLLQEKLKDLKYLSFDQYSVRDFAESNPETFLAQYSAVRPLVIDEAQKVPRIFDAVKFEVDRKRIPGRFLLLGSTEFSKLSLIRESLTGRMSKIRLFPLNIAETLGLPPSSSLSPGLMADSPRITRAQWLLYLARGGMPGIFSVRNESERESLMSDWLDLTAKRDAPLFPKIKVDPDLCMRILEKVATLEEPDAGNIARSLKRDLRRVKTHIEVLLTLFVLHALEAHPSGTGKTWYFLCDVAFARKLGAGFERQIHTWLVQEQLSQRSYRDDRDSRLFYYRTPKGRVIHLVVEEGAGKLAAIKVLPAERILERDLEILRAFQKKIPSKSLSLLALGSGRISFKREKIEIYPWEALGG